MYAGRPIGLGGRSGSFGLSEWRTEEKCTILLALEIPVNGVLDSMNASAAWLSSAISSSVKRCVHFSGLFA